MAPAIPDRPDDPADQCDNGGNANTDEPNASAAADPDVVQAMHPAVLTAAGARALAATSKGIAF
jgi:hypothetical protein